MIITGGDDNLHLVGVELNLEQLSQRLNVSGRGLAAVAGRGAALSWRTLNRRFQKDRIKTTFRSLQQSQTGILVLARSREN